MGAVAVGKAPELLGTPGLCPFASIGGLVAPLPIGDGDIALQPVNRLGCV